jgi:hypothetical protein
MSTMMGEAKIEQAPHARDVAADRRIHEAGEQRHAADPEQARFGIDPRSDAGLEELHGGADDVEDQDHLGFLDRLEAESEHRGLDGEGGQEHEIVTGERGAGRVPTMGRQDERDHQPAEQAGPGLLYAEADEFVDTGARGPLLRPSPEPLLGGNEAGERGPQRGRALGRPA